MMRHPRRLASALLTICLLHATSLTASAQADVPHTVLPGETLSGIAAANGLPTATLASANGLSDQAFVIADTTLQVPAAGTAPAAVAPVSAAPATAPTVAGGTAGGGHLVIPGETLSGIAVANGLTTAAVASANGLSDQAFVIAGTRLRIPAASAGAPTASSVGTSAPPPMGGYTIRAGDTLSGLAARSGVPVEQMAAMNGLRADSWLLAGAPLKFPTGSPVLASAPAASSAPVAVTVAPAATPNAAPGRVTAGQVAGIAAGHGVPGSLAAAIAWQESGFNNAMVSSANARGVMQIMPGTWAWVQSNLASRPLNPSSAEDNVHAGSLYLAQLLRDTGGDPAMAAAAYYQGLSSVRRVGMFPETRQYVDNVLALRGRFGG